MQKKFVKKAFSLMELSLVIMVIGILVTGVASGSRIVYQARIATAQSLTRNSVVNGILGLVLWVETSLDNNITSVNSGLKPVNNDPILAWTDISSSKIILGQSTVASRPTYIKNGINNLPTLSFDGGDALFSSATPLRASSTSYTMIAVFKKSFGDRRDISGRAKTCCYR